MNRPSSAPALWAVVPVKPFSEAKSRLAPLLSAPQRAALARTMFEDVLAAIARASGLAGLTLVSRDSLVPNILASWVKMGREGIETCLRAGATA